MKYFTDRPMERVMMQLPHAQRDQPPQPPEGHSCHGCKRYGEGCVLPCYRGVEVIPPIPDRARSR